MDWVCNVEAGVFEAEDQRAMRSIENPGFICHVPGRDAHSLTRPGNARSGVTCDATQPTVTPSSCSVPSYLMSSLVFKHTEAYILALIVTQVSHGGWHILADCSELLRWPAA